MLKIVNLIEGNPNIYKNRNGIVLTDVLIVNHITEGSYNSAVSWLKNPNSGVSSHFVTSRKGDCTQLVDLKDGAWCNGSKPNNPESKIYNGKARNSIVKASKHNANLFTVSIEHEGIYAQTKGALTEEQYQTTLELHKHIIQEIRKLYDIVIKIDREHICGHVDITPIIKPYCPGEKFPFDRLIKDLKIWEEQQNAPPKELKKEQIPDWKKNGLDVLVENGIINNPEIWIEKLNEPLPAWAEFNINARILKLINK